MRIMAGGMIHRKAARRLALVWQASAVVLALGAGVLWAVELPMVSGAAPVVPPPVNVPVAPSAPPSPPVDREAVLSIAERLEAARKPVARASPPAPAAGVGQPPASSGLAWRYLGAIIEPTRRLALLSINGSQRMLAQGRSIESRDASGRVTQRATLVEVREDAIVIDDGGRRIEIQKEDRVGPTVAWVPPVPGGGAVAAGVPAGQAMTAAQLDELRRRGLDGNEAQRMREAASAARRAAAKAVGGAGGQPPPATSKAPALFTGGSRANTAGESASDASREEAGGKGPTS
jgi:hypothetical protein